MENCPYCGGDESQCNYDFETDNCNQIRNMTMPESQSLGAKRVRESFNPSGDMMVDKIKRYTADLIDLCEELKVLDGRLAALAQTAYEDAAMWAVKAATTGK